MKYLVFFILSMFAIKLNAQDLGAKRYLYGTNEIPGASKKLTDLDERDKPKLYSHLVQNPNNKDIVFLVIPGGGYGMVAINHEGHDVAKRLNDAGYNAYVLDYRLPKKETMIDKRFGPLQDAQYAISIIRKENKGKKVAVIGFSAGGHLAASLSTLYKLPQTKELKKANLRPDFSILCYPVITMDEAITHKGTKQNLIGPDIKESDVELFSTENQINKNSQPTFLMSAIDDQGVPIENSYRYQSNLNKYKIPNTIFTYEKGGHGFGLNNKTDSRDWLKAALEWIDTVNK